MAEVEEEKGLDFGRIKGLLAFYAAKWGYEHAAMLRLHALREVVARVKVESFTSLTVAKRSALSSLITKVLAEDLPNYMLVAPLISRMSLWVPLLSSRTSPTLSLVIYAIKDVDAIMDDTRKRIPPASYPKASAILQDVIKGECPFFSQSLITAAFTTLTLHSTHPTTTLPTPTSSHRVEKH
jgi:hypothetical protein